MKNTYYEVAYVFSASCYFLPLKFKYSLQHLKFEILTLARMLVATFWVVILCSVVNGLPMFRTNVSPPSSGLK